MEQNQFLEQKQTLQLSPRMYQSIKILQMSGIELNRWLERESMENPVLEINSNQSSLVIAEPENEETLLGTEVNNELNNTLLDYLSGQIKSLKPKPVLPTEQESSPEIKKEMSKKIAFSDNLLSQLRIMTKSELECKIGEYLIGNIDHNGYLTISCRVAAQDLKVTEKEVKRILAIIQNLSLPGIGARNLKECLLLQLKYFKFPEKENLKKIILFYLDELAKKDYKVITNSLNLTNSEIEHLSDILKKYFDPKPGRAYFQDNAINFSWPDIVVKKVNNRYDILENKNFSPDVKINIIYERMLAKLKEAEKLKNPDTSSVVNETDTKQTLEYLENKINSAHWILKCIEQRRNTVMKITRFIIDYQYDFLEKGVTFLKPLTLEQAAELLDLNKSTISRAIKFKKIQLPRGIYDLKYFFSKGLPQNGNIAISNEKIKNIIMSYIKEENRSKPYSDQQLSELLRDEREIKVARRTIAKYRMQMNIPSAKLRRKYN